MGRHLPETTRQRCCFAREKPHYRFGRGSAVALSMEAAVRRAHALLRAVGADTADRAGRREEHHLRHVPPAAGELDLRRCGARLDWNTRLVTGDPVTEITRLKT